MTLDFEAARNAVLAPQGVEFGQIRAPQPMLPFPPITDDTFRARVVGSAVDTIVQHLRVERSLPQVARLLGLGYGYGDISAVADTEVPHDLGRLPVVIVLSIPVDGQSGMVVGRPEGGGSPNTLAWTRDRVAVRATVAGRYAFLVM